MTEFAVPLPTGVDGKELTSRGAATRQRLLDAAEDVFAELGYHEASIVKITEAAGVAFVVAKEPVSEEALLEHCRERLAKFKVPKRVRFVDALPMSAMNKVLKGELRALDTHEVPA